MVTPACCNLICCIFLVTLKVEVTHAHACAQTPTHVSGILHCYQSSQGVQGEVGTTSPSQPALLFAAAILGGQILQDTISHRRSHRFGDLFNALFDTELTFPTVCRRPGPSPLTSILPLSLRSCSESHICINERWREACAVSGFVGKFLVFSFCLISGHLVPGPCISLGAG